MKTEKARVVRSLAANGDGLMKLVAGEKGTGETLHVVRYWPWSPKSVEGAENLIQAEAGGRGLTIVYDQSSESQTMSDWTVLSRVPARDTATITLRVDGVVYLSCTLFQEMGQPDNVQVLVDVPGRRLGVRAAAEAGPETFPVRSVMTKGKIVRYFAGSRAAWERAGITVIPTRSRVAAREGDLWYIQLDSAGRSEPPSAPTT